MATHVLRRSINLLHRVSSLRLQTARHISVIANRYALNSYDSKLNLTEKVQVFSLPAWRASTCRLYSEGPSLTSAELEERTLEVIKSFDKVDPDKVTLDAHFINDMGLDSLDVVDILMAFEDEFGVEISDEQAEKIFTPKEAIAFMKTFLDIHDDH